MNYANLTDCRNFPWLFFPGMKISWRKFHENKFQEIFFPWNWKFQENISIPRNGKFHEKNIAWLKIPWKTIPLHISFMTENILITRKRKFHDKIIPWQKIPLVNNDFHDRIFHDGIDYMNENSITENSLSENFLRFHPLAGNQLKATRGFSKHLQYCIAFCDNLSLHLERCGSACIQNNEKIIWFGPLCGRISTPDASRVIGMEPDTIIRRDGLLGRVNLK